MYEYIEIVINAALLHDIGKIIRRGGETDLNHSKKGADFIANNKININNKKIIVESILNHHYKELVKSNLNSNHIAYIIYEADNIAAGIDRRKENVDEITHEWIPLHSVFNHIRPELGNENLVYNLIHNSEENIIYPIPFFKNVGKGKYTEIVNTLNKHLKLMNYDLQNSNSILKLYEALTQYIPSSTYIDYPDISLFDHSKITAAIASCMYIYCEENQIKDYKEQYFINSKENRDKKNYLLVSGDLSGIQNFIYTISSKGALKSLRGRSFYLEILIENIVDEILVSMNLSRANLLYSGGGHFYLLLADTKDTVNLLKKAKNNINEWLIKNYSIDLYLSLAWKSCSANELGNDLGRKDKNSNLTGDIFNSVSKEISKDKLSRYSESQLKALFNPDSNINKIEDYSRECAICKKSSSDLVEYGINDEEKIIICKNCLSFIKIGEQIPHTRKSINDDNLKLIVISNENFETEDTLKVPSIYGNTRHLFFKNYKKLRDELNNGEEFYRIYSINRLFIGDKYSTNIWVGNYSIENEENKGLIEFKELADRSKGIKRLGVLRADVDNLGSIFISGFENESSKDNKYKFVSLSREAAFSRQLSIFFKHNINQLCEGKIGDIDRCNMINNNDDQMKRNLVIVYSGGDDVFVVGSWNDVIEFAIDLRNSFKKFTSSKLTFSAGIGFFNSGFPINQMANLTGKLEEIAKTKISGKDSIALFGIDHIVCDENSSKEEHVYKWDKFIDNVINEKYKFLTNIFSFEDEQSKLNKLSISTSFVYKLMNLIRERLNGEKKINIARIAYLLARKEPRNKEKHESYIKFKNQLFKWILSENDSKELLTAINLLIYTNRTEGSNIYA